MNLARSKQARPDEACQPRPLANYRLIRKDTPMPVNSKIVLATLLAMRASSAAAQSIETNPPTLVLVGEAEQAGNPDIAVVTLGIVTEREHAGAALHASGDTMRAVIGLA